MRTVEDLTKEDIKDEKADVEQSQDSQPGLIRRQMLDRLW